MCYVFLWFAKHYNDIQLLIRAKLSLKFIVKFYVYMCFLTKRAMQFCLGIPVQEVIFDPIQDQTSQEATVTIAIDDDDVALEENEILYFSLSDPQGVTLSKPSSINVSIEDDDGKH